MVRVVYYADSSVKSLISFIFYHKNSTKNLSLSLYEII